MLPYRFNVQSAINHVIIVCPEKLKEELNKNLKDPEYQRFLYESVMKTLNDFKQKEMHEYLLKAHKKRSERVHKQMLRNYHLCFYGSCIGNIEFSICKELQQKGKCGVKTKFDYY